MPMKLNEREYRAMTLRVSQNDAESKKVVGYASTFNEPYVLYGDDDFEVREIVDADAFADTDMTDVIFQYNHEGRVFARTRNKTLSVKPDERGLLIEADLGHTEIGRQLYEEIRGGYTDKMSFGFTVTSDEMHETNEGEKRIYTRVIKSVGKLFDVSAVSIPANDATSISVRALTDGVIEKAKAERLLAEQREIARKRLALKIKLMEV